MFTTIPHPAPLQDDSVNGHAPIDARNIKKGFYGPRAKATRGNDSRAALPGVLAARPKNPASCISLPLGLHRYSRLLPAKTTTAPRPICRVINRFQRQPLHCCYRTSLLTFVSFLFTTEWRAPLYTAVLSILMTNLFLACYIYAHCKTFWILFILH